MTLDVVIADMELTVTGIVFVAAHLAGFKSCRHREGFSYRTGLIGC